MTPRHHHLVGPVLVALALAPGCREDGGGGGDEDGSGDAGDADEGSGAGESSDESGGGTTTVDGVGVMGVRRLTVYEYDNALRDLLGDDTRPGATLLPEDARTPFDNAFASQSASRVLVEAAETLAREAAERLAADPARRDQIVGCEGAAPDDGECMRDFVTRFGRRALRRPLDAAELDEIVALGLEVAAEAQSFDTGALVVLRALLQDPSFLYRIERGTAVTDADGDALWRLDAFEVATRMSFVLWGSVPDDALLDAAAAGELDDGEGRRASAMRMLADSRARTHAQRFHAAWLGYERLPHEPEMVAAMRRESDALVERVVFDDAGPWTDLLRMRESWIDAMLADIYAVAAPDDAWGWVDLSGTSRQGILSHASFLSVASNALETSPVKRGKLVRERLMCSPIPPPPPDVAADSPPEGLESECKSDRYTQHRADPACAACHELMDPVGFGLEEYDRWGAYREFDYVPEEEIPNTDCPIDGQGELVGVGTFRGPAELSELLVGNEIVQACVVQQVYSYAMGHAIDTDDLPFVDELTATFGSAGRFDELLLALVAADAFAYRRQEQE
jgi:hypothetical protein